MESWLASPTAAFDGALPDGLPAGFREYFSADYAGVGRSALKKKAKPRDAEAAA